MRGPWHDAPMQTRMLAGTLISNGQRIENGLVLTGADRILYSGPAAQAPAELLAQAKTCENHITTTANTAPNAPAIITPGLVDVHHHGAYGVDFGTSDEAAIRAVLPRIWATGTTSVMASLITASVDVMLQRIQLLVPLVEEGLLAGIHLEGPYLAPGRCGAHNPTLLQEPKPAEVTALFEAGAGTIRSTTYAPELPGAKELERIALEFGAVASVGHTQASFDCTAQALQRVAEALNLQAPLEVNVPRLDNPTGKRPTITHLFNGMDPLHHRAPGAVAAALRAASRGQAVAELIADGAHLADTTAATVMELVGAENIALVTDSTPAAQLPDGEYPWGTNHVRLTNGVARLVTPVEDAAGIAVGRSSVNSAALNTAPLDGGKAPLAGGTASLLEVVNRMVAAGVSAPAALRSATQVPAAALGLAAEVGTLNAGSRADLLVLTEAKGGTVELEQVVRAGGPVGRVAAVSSPQ